MFNTKSNAIKLSKKKYINILKTKDISSYILHEKMTNSLNRSLMSNGLDTTTDKSYLTRSQINSYSKLPVNENEKNSYKIKKCSYTDFLALRNKKITAPFNYTDERFKWQNLKEEHLSIDPSIYTRPHKKQFLLKETFGEGMLSFINREKLPDNKPKIKRYRRYNSENGNNIQNIDIEISRRVINPEYNNESQNPRKQKRSMSQTRAFLHRTTGNIGSLFDISPVYIEYKTKKLYKYKSYGALCLDLFSSNYAKYEMPKHTKKLFHCNRCYFDTIKYDDLVHDMNNCWKSSREYGKKRKNWSYDEKCLSKKNMKDIYDHLFGINEELSLCSEKRIQVKNTFQRLYNQGFYSKNKSQINILDKGKNGKNGKNGKKCC